METKIVYFNGKEYRRSPKSKYYFEYTTKNEDRKKSTQLHRAVWEYYNGKIPKGYQIHHKDHNIDNNNIENLECLSAREHLSKHSKENWKKEEYKEKMSKQMQGNSERQNKCREWHKSEEGKEWHSEHAKRSILLQNPEKRICEYCKKEYIPKIKRQKSCCKTCSREGDKKQRRERTKNKSSL